MKLINNGCVYVQLNDIVQISGLVSGVPRTVYTKAFQGKSNIIDDSNRYKFVKYDEPDEIIFFMNQYWIIDYNQFKNKTPEEIQEYAHSLFLEEQEIVDEFNNLPESEQDKNYSMLREHRLLRHMFVDLKLISDYKDGILNMEIPGEEIKVVCDTTYKEKPLTR